MKSSRRNSFLGQDGFIWWVGVVVDRLDPLNVGRCKVRIKGIHADNLAEVSNEDLPWAQPLNPVNGSFQSPSTLKEGDFVMGFFMDGEQGQYPIVMGHFATIPEVPTNGSAFRDPRTSKQLEKAPQTIASIQYKKDGTGVTVQNNNSLNFPNRFNEPVTSRLSRNENIDSSIINTKNLNILTGIKYTASKSWSEPKSPYNAIYPYNHVTETESGHYIELDDTKNSERLHFYHRTGTFIEMHPTGDRVDKIVGDNYTIILKNNQIVVLGDCNITVQKDCNLKVEGNLNMDVSKNVSWKIGGTMNWDVGGAVTWNFGKTYDTKVTGNMTTTAPLINFNG
jgi:hypothetical protein